MERWLKEGTLSKKNINTPSTSSQNNASVQNTVDEIWIGPP